MFLSFLFTFLYLASFFFIYDHSSISLISGAFFGTFWCSFCAGLLCFFDRNLAISGARFVLVSCAFLIKTWRFLALVLCWSLVLFWSKLGDFWRSSCAGLLCFFDWNLAISGARFVLVSCAFLIETWRFLALVLCWSLVLFFELHVIAPISSEHWLKKIFVKTPGSWRSFCAGQLCFFWPWLVAWLLLTNYFPSCVENLCLAAWANFLACFFSLVLILLRWSLVLFWSKLGDFWCSFCAGLLCFFDRNLAISGARFVLVSCAFLIETWRFLVLVLCWSLVLFWSKLGDFWRSFCAGLLCFFDQNLAISGARFALVSCAFLIETWRFLVLVLCWSLVLFWSKLGDFWCSFCASLLCFFDQNLAISGARFVLVSCAFLIETWRFLVLVLCWSLVLFWSKLGDFWCSFCAGLLRFLRYSVRLCQTFLLCNITLREKCRPFSPMGLGFRVYRGGFGRKKQHETTQRQLF